jgi:hypothetical protein
MGAKVPGRPHDDRAFADLLRRLDPEGEYDEAGRPLSPILDPPAEPEAAKPPRRTYRESPPAAPASDPLGGFWWERQ